jgi:hypothetical protein
MVPLPCRDGLPYQVLILLMFHDDMLSELSTTSSKLMSVLTDPSVHLAKNVSYPYDDMLIGSWIADVAPEPETKYIKDPLGFHDPTGHGWTEKSSPIDWDNVVIHHINEENMRGLRQLDQFKDEFEV